MTAESRLLLNNLKYSDRQIRVNNVDPDQTAPSSMIRAFCLHLLGSLIILWKNHIVKIYDYFWDVLFFRIFTVLLQELPKIFAIDVLPIYIRIRIRIRIVTGETPKRQSLTRTCD